MRVTIWNEYRHEKTNDFTRKLYPYGMHKVMAQSFDGCEDVEVGFATLDEPEHGLTDAVLDATDVLFWWGHRAHDEVSDEIVRKVQQRVLSGMGLVVLHSGHYSKIFKTLMGTNCSLKWREAAEKERLWNIAPSHPITQGIGEYIELPDTEMYGERFDIPEPDRLIFISWFEGGEVFRSGCTWNRGNGRVFYFRPGHETFPIYYNPQIQTILQNAAYWAAKSVEKPTNIAPNAKESPEAIKKTDVDFSHAPHMNT
ncbi:MAG: ThuA domain-containing protein [Opitutales bacterium]|nr:ThuA domain-containing protein [Opitutales bacterium]